MNTKQDLLKRVSDLIDLASKTLGFAGTDSFEFSKARLRSQSLQFISFLNGTSDPNYSEFENASRHNSSNSVANCKSILEGIKHDIDNDYYLSSLRNLVSAEIFSDYIEMAEYLLSEKYKVPAAVLVGSTLEAHLRKLCQKNNIDIDWKDPKGKTHFKMGNDFNSDLYKKNIITKVDMGLNEGWIKIRNEAAHGNDTAFTEPQVVNMLQGVKEFIGRNPL